MTKFGISWEELANSITHTRLIYHNNPKGAHNHTKSLYGKSSLSYHMVNHHNHYHTIPKAHNYDYYYDYDLLIMIMMIDSRKVETRDFLRETLRSRLNKGHTRPLLWVIGYFFMASFGVLALILG